MLAARHWLNSSLPAFVLMAVLAFTALSCGDGGDPPIVKPDPPAVNSIVVSPGTVSFDALNDTLRLSASVLDQYGQPMPGASVLWVSGDATVATVDQAGLVRSVRNGQTTVRAQAGLRRDTVQVAVTQTPHTVAVEAGNGQLHWTGFVLRDTLRVRVQDGVGTPVPGREVTWTVMVGGGQVEFPTTSTDAAGMAWNRWLLGDTATGTQRLSANVPNLSPVFFQATGFAPIAVLNPGSLSAPLLDTLPVTFLALDSLGARQAGIPVQFGGITGFGEIVQGPSTTDVKGELVARWALGPTPGSQTLLATRTDINRAIPVEASGTGQVDAWPFTTVTAGVSHTCGLDGAGTAYCWGRGDNQRLGTGDSISVSAPVPVASGLSWTDISAGLRHSCALEGPGAQIHCWGQGFQTGQGGNVIVPTPLPVPGGPWASLTAGEAHQCALAVNGSGYCWGVGLYGRLGNGLPDSIGYPTLVSGGHSWAQLSAGRYHTCGLTTSAQAYCWGRGTEGQLGNGATQDTLAPVPVFGGYQWQSISAGWAHTCGITVEGDAFCWGEGSALELGNGSATDQNSPVKVAGNRAWSAIGAGERHSCGIDADKKLYCWGAGGLVGLGSVGAGMPALLAPDDQWESVETLYRHTCAVTSDARTFCWGANDYGQLGIRTTVASTILRLVFRGVILP